MSLAASTNWELRTTGNDLNGGGYVAGGGGTDRSQSDAAYDSGTNLTVDATTDTDVTPDGYVVSAADVGNIIQITAGAGFTLGFYEIKSIQGGTKWRLDRWPAAVSTAGATWSIGGALASPGKVASAVENENVVWQKAGDYPIGSGSANTSGNKVSIVKTTIRWIGYDAVRGDRAARPVFRATAGSINLFAIADGLLRFRIENVEFDGDGQSSVYGFYASGTISFIKIIDCLFRDLYVGALTYLSGTSIFMRCRATACSSIGFAGGNSQYFECVSHDNSGFGFSSISCFYQNCIAARNTSSGFFNTNYYGFHRNCVSYDNNSYGFEYGDFGPGGESVDFFSCIAYGNTFYGFYVGQSHRGLALLWNSAGGNNTSGPYNVGYPSDAENLIREFQALTANPFVDPDAAITSIESAFTNFELNDVIGVGSVCRGVGLTPNYDIGATQHPDYTPAEVAAAMWAYANRTLS